MESDKKKVYKLTALNTSNNTVQIILKECSCCNELVPDVGNCPDCDTHLKHIKTIENFETGFLHYVYECSGCPENQRKAQKILKLMDVVDETRINLRKNLVDDFLKSGGY